MKRLFSLALLGARFALGCAGHSGAVTVADSTHAAPPASTAVTASAPASIATAESAAPANPATVPAGVPAPNGALGGATGLAPGFPPCGMPSTLVARGWRSELAPASATESPPFEAGTTTLVVLPDTQYYASCESRYFRDQVRWAAAEKARRNVAVAVTLGDLTDRNTPEQWRFIHDGLRPVENELPFVLVTGNHDHARGGTAGDRSSLFQRTFPHAPGAAQQLLAESMQPGNVENAYYRVRLAHVTLGVLALEWSPRAATVAWANHVLDRYASDRAIIVTHAYLYNDGTRYDWQAKGKLQEWNPLSYGTGLGAPERQPRAAPLEPDAAYDGEMLWRDLAAGHAGVFLVLSGHVLGSGTGVLASRGERGNLVQQVLVNFQMLKDGGLGYLRLLELLPDGKTLRMKTFSPTLGVFATQSDQTGTLAIEPPLW